MKESEGDRLKCVVYESTLSTADAVPLPQWGRQRGGGFAAKKKANPASLRSASPSQGRGLCGYALLPIEGGAPKGRRLDGESGISVSQPSPMGKAKRRRLRRKKGSQPRLALLGSPFQGKGLTWIFPPSYGRRCPEGAEVGWREAVFPKQSLPRVGKVASGASRIGY